MRRVAIIAAALLSAATASAETVLYDGTYFRLEVAELGFVGTAEDLQAVALTAVAKDVYKPSTFAGTITGGLHQEQYQKKAGVYFQSPTDAYWYQDELLTPSPLDSHFMVGDYGLLIVTAPYEAGFAATSAQSATYSDDGFVAGFATSLGGQFGLQNYPLTTWQFVTLVGREGSTFQLDFAIAGGGKEDVVCTSLTLSPEPATGGLLVCGSLLLLGRRRR